MKYLFLFLLFVPLAQAETVYVYDENPVKEMKAAYKQAKAQSAAKQWQCAELGSMRVKAEGANYRYESYGHCSQPAIEKPDYPIVKQHKDRIKEVKGKWDWQYLNYLEKEIYPVVRKACKDTGDAKACEVRATIRSYFSEQAPMYVHRSSWEANGYNKNGYRYMDQE